MLRKQAVTYGNQWDKFLSGTFYGHIETNHMGLLGENPHLCYWCRLLYSIRGNTPLHTQLEPVVEFTDYRPELVVSLSYVRLEEVKSISKAQK